MKLWELTASEWEHAEDNFRECDRKYETAELKVPAIANLNNISTAVQSAEFVDGLV
jgi:hypothetical protein